MIHEYCRDELPDLSAYESFMHNIAGQEIFHARVKGAKFRLGDDVFYASRYTSDASSSIFKKAISPAKILFSYRNDNEPEEEDELEDVHSSTQCVIL